MTGLIAGLAAGVLCGCPLGAWWAAMRAARAAGPPEYQPCEEPGATFPDHEPWMP
jgi:hypothetical protein